MKSHIPVQLCCSVSGENHCKETEETTHNKCMLPGLNGNTHHQFIIKSKIQKNDILSFKAKATVLIAKPKRNELEYRI